MKPHATEIDLEAYRPRLFALTYRMLGDVHDAEDLVQEAFARWHEAETEAVRQPEGWLVSVATRLSIDRLRRRKVERATYDGPWLPEPIRLGRQGSPTDRAAEMASDLSMAFLVLLERLAPEERAAFLLREVFDRSYAEIALVLGKSEAAARQTVHRSRDRVRAERTRFAVPKDVVEKLLQRFLTALHTDDEEALLALFTPDATYTSDGGGKVRAARNVVRGSDRIARLLWGVKAKYPRPVDYSLEEVNAEPALVGREGSRIVYAIFLETDGERIEAVYVVMNPDKLADLEGAAGPT